MENPAHPRTKPPPAHARENPSRASYVSQLALAEEEYRSNAKPTGPDPSAVKTVFPMKVRSWLQVAVPLGVPPFCDSHARQSNGENQEGLLQSSRNELRAEHIFVTAQNARNKSRNRERGGEEPDADIPPELACLCRRRRGIHTSILTVLVSERKPPGQITTQILKARWATAGGNATSRSGAKKAIHETGA